MPKIATTVADVRVGHRRPSARAGPLAVASPLKWARNPTETREGPSFAPMSASRTRHGNTSRTIAAALALAAAGAAGCELTDLNPPPPQTPTDKAAALERSSCGPDVDDARLIPVVTGNAVDSVEPLYAGSDTRLSGAVIRIRASQGVTPEWLDRALECHGAKRVLRHTPNETLANDPFWLPGRMVDIQTEPAQDSFKVAVRGESTDDAQEILIRANAYLAANRRAPQEATR